MAVARHIVGLPEGIRARMPLVKRWSQRVRSRHLFVVDVVGLVLAALVALAAWPYPLPYDQLVGAHAWVIGIIVCAHVVANIVLGLYTNSWRYASIGDMGRIMACTFAGSALAILIVSAINLAQSPVSEGVSSAGFWLLEATLALGVLATPRFMIRAASDLSVEVAGRHERQRTLLYGAGWAGVMVARSADRSPEAGVVPVGFLDDNLDLKGRRVGGLSVFGDTTAMGKAKRKTGATSLLITMPRATGDNVRRVVEAALEHGLDVRTVPAMTDIIDGTIDATRTRRVRVEDLLRRPSVTEHSPALGRLLHGRTVMITGAAGSIGSELVRQVLLLEPGRIVMVDQAESAMYMTARDLESRSQVVDGATTITTHLVDVTDRLAMLQLMSETVPVVVFHAAAYKHVPLLEDHAAQAVRVNLGGTQTVVDASVECGVDHFVLVSTDKAVEPTSVMGASKRIAEMIVADAARRTGKAYVSVRFGNVLGSNGSVVPVFQSQLENGQPLTVTDPEMTRYFMTIPEASWLILDAAALSDHGGLFVLDMGEPVRIMDVAHDLIRLSGRDPDAVPIRFVGLRPGEKLHEELFYGNEQVAPTDVAKVLRCTTAQLAPEGVQADVERWKGLARRGHDEQLRLELLEYVRSTAAVDEVAAETIAAGINTNGFRPVVPIPVLTDGNGHKDTRRVVRVHDNGTGRRSVDGTKAPVQASRAGGNGASDDQTDLLQQRIVIRSPVEGNGSSGGAERADEGAPAETERA